MASTSSPTLVTPFSAQSRTAEWPADGLVRVPHCPICSCAKRRLLYRHLFDRVFFCAPGTWNLFECLSCHTGYLDPVPTPSTIWLAYSRYYTHTSAVADAESSSRAPLLFLARWVKMLGNAYRNRFCHPGPAFIPSSRLPDLLLPFLSWKTAELDAERRWLPKPDLPGSVLDIGCGNGDFLELSQRSGWNAQGIDLDANAVQACRKRGLRVMHGGIEDLRRHTEKFDYVTLFHVLEHVHDPIAWLVVIRSLLKPSGKLIVEVPNLYSSGHRTYGRNWLNLDPPRHLTHFNPESLRQALRMTGYTVIRPAPWYPLCLKLFTMSDGIRRQRDPFSHAMSAIVVRQALKAEWKAYWNPDLRENVAYVAQ